MTARIQFDHSVPRLYRAVVCFAGSLAAFLAGSLVVAPSARAQTNRPEGGPPGVTTTVESKPTPATCLLRGEHSRLELPLSAGAESASLQFRTAGTTGAGAWYQVAAVKKPDRWVAVLPQPTSAARVHYRLIAKDAAGTVVARLPARGAYIADVVAAACPTGTAPTELTAAISVSVPDGSPRVPPGFVATNITAFIAEPPNGKTATPTPPTAPGTQPAAPRRLAVGSRFRITGRDGVRHSGVVTKSDGTGVRIGQKQFAWSDIAQVEEYEPPGGGKRVVGALAGLAGGFALSIVYYVASEDADSATPLYVCTIGGGLIGALVVGGSWRTVDLRGPVVEKNETTIEWLARRVFVAPRRGGAQLGLGLVF